MGGDQVWSPRPQGTQNRTGEAKAPPALVGGGLGGVLQLSGDGWTPATFSVKETTTEGGLLSSSPWKTQWEPQEWGS